jgi:hypothetical protein
MKVQVYHFTPPQLKALESQLEDDMNEGIVRQVLHHEVKFLFPVFTVEGKKGKMQTVMNCKMINVEQVYIHFRMDGPEVVQVIALVGDWATSLDLKSAFNHRRVGKALEPFFGFTHQGKYYVYAGMPFGARHSPRIFTRALAYALAYVRVHWEVRIIAYMDDLLLLHQDSSYLRLATMQIASYLQSLGWTLSLGKCELMPKQEIVFLGWTLSLRKSMFYMIKQWVRKAERGEIVSCKRLGSLIGCLNFLRAQIPRASLYLRTLHTALAEMVRWKGWNGWASIMRRIISELLFWWRSVWYNTS